MADKYDYNLVVIGAGSAGLVTSYIAAQLNAKVALIEKHKMGGDCLNTGCIPSKAFIRSANFISQLKHAKIYGVEHVDYKFNFSDVMNRVHQVIQQVEPHDSIERYTDLGVHCIQGEARITSPYTVEVNGQVLTTKAIVIATGARPRLPNIEGLKDIDFLTSDNLWDIKQQPNKLAVMGAGPIGCELAQAFSRLGTEVTLIEATDRILPKEDQDVSTAIAESFNKDGVHVLLNHKVIKAQQLEQKKSLTIESHEKTYEMTFDQVLVCVGRQANTTGFGLENIGVQLNHNGTVQVNDFLQTNFNNIYACGDVAGPYQFTHVASHQAYYACVNALFRPITKFIPPPFNKAFKVNYSVIPWATFTSPEVATVGLTETEAKKLGQPYDLTTYGMDDLDRAIADSNAFGFIKVLTQKKSDKILGATIVGAHASDLITEFISAMKNGYGLNSILGTIHIYPTMAEANKYLAGNWKKKNKPVTILKLLKKFFRMAR